MMQGGHDGMKMGGGAMSSGHSGSGHGGKAGMKCMNDGHGGQSSHNRAHASPSGS